MIRRRARFLTSLFLLASIGLLIIRYVRKTNYIQVQPKQVEKEIVKHTPSPDVQTTATDQSLWTQSTHAQTPNEVVQSEKTIVNHVKDEQTTVIAQLTDECPVVLRQNSNKKTSKLGCEIPKLDPFHQSIMKFISDVPPASCSDFKSYGKLVNGRIIFTNPDVVSANYRLIERDGDFKFVLGTSVPVPKSNEKGITKEFIEVDYLLKDDKHKFEVFLQPVPHSSLKQRKAKKEPGIPLNILIIAIDSLSHANTQRKLPKVYKYLKDDLGAFMFNGHSIVGDGTTEQLAAMLTGLGELEQYEARRHHEGSKPVDGWTWIFKQLKEHGYLTGFSEDSPYLGSFTYRLHGFTNPPTDFYPRPFWFRAHSALKGGGNYCLGSRNIAQYQFDYLKDIFKMFPEKLKFFLSFNDRFAHNGMNTMSRYEPDLLSLLHHFKTNNYLNNTLLIIMGDHGARYGTFRQLMQGKLEERLPLFSMAFPPWFSARYPKLAENLRTNTDRLTSWFDVYATFRHMLSYPKTPRGLKHGQSLLQKVPTSRTCENAAVEKHWCPCLEWVAVNTSHSHVQKGALAAVGYINGLNKKFKESAKRCEILRLKKINYALLERPNEKMLSFKETNDLKPAFSENAVPAHKGSCRYQIQLVTSPNQAVYEVSLQYEKKRFIIKSDISRVNRYGDQPKCIADSLPHLRKFCLCKKR